jgi:hypothetical protein
MKNSFVYYIAGIFDGEGSVDKRSLTITNTDKTIINITSFYLNKLGIAHRIKIRPKEKSYYKTCYDIKISGRKNLETFYTYIPFVHRDKRHKMLQETIVYSSRKVTEAIYHKILKLRRQKLSLRNICRVLNLGLGTVTYFLNKGKY